jgi:hypothetical protein
MWLQVSFPLCQYCADHSHLSQPAFHKVRVMAFVLPGMKWSVNCLMYFMIANWLCIIENNCPAFYASFVAVVYFCYNVKILQYYNIHMFLKPDRHLFIEKCFWHCASCICPIWSQTSGCAVLLHWTQSCKHSNNAEGTCCCFRGLVLQDLTFVHIGNSDLLPDGSINFSKRWQQFNIVENMKRFKKGQVPTNVWVWTACYVVKGCWEGLSVVQNVLLWRAVCEGLSAGQNVLLWRAVWPGEERSLKVFETKIPWTTCGLSRQERRGEERRGAGPCAWYGNGWVFAGQGIWGWDQLAFLFGDSSDSH